MTATSLPTSLPATSPPQVDIPVLNWVGCYNKRWGDHHIVGDALLHPAKFARLLIDRIYDHGFEQGWWRAGDLVADPFAGVACGGLTAAYKGLQWIGVELEERFFRIAGNGWQCPGNGELGEYVPGVLNPKAIWPVCRGCCRKWRRGSPWWNKPTEPHHATGNIQKHRLALEHLGLPVPILLKGDSRRFSELIGRHVSGARADGVVTSPAFGERTPDAVPQPGGNQGVEKAYKQAGAKESTTKYGGSTGQIGGMVTSPPYQRGLGHGGKSEKFDQMQSDKELPASGYGEDPGQIENLPPGQPTAVVTSPPYVSGGHHNDVFGAWNANQRGQGVTSKDSSGYGAEQGQIGSLPSLPAGVVTSPPWEDQECAMAVGKFKDADVAAEKLSNVKGNRSTKKARAEQIEEATQQEYGSSEGQIAKAGVRETYWDAMRAVYGQCLEVIRPGGVMCVVMKDYVRDKKIVPLCDQTLELLVSLGFEPVVRIQASFIVHSSEHTLFEGEKTSKKERKSFFRRVGEAKGSPPIDHEEVIVVRKPHPEPTP